MIERVSPHRRARIEHWTAQVILICDLAIEHVEHVWRDPGPRSVMRHHDAAEWYWRQTGVIAELDRQEYEAER